MNTIHDPELGELVPLPFSVYCREHDAVAGRPVPILLRGAMVARASELAEFVRRITADAKRPQEPIAEESAAKARKGATK